MRIESVRAHAFGPLIDRNLELAPGMTVICGPNESGKSTWHAALYAALCGMRRGPGRRSEDREFADRYHPWNAPNWEVSAIVRLEDGRRVELRHDLDGGVDCQARDVDLGRDYSNQIINDGAPDGARWLGLDRRSFLATACVRQADIQSVIDHANSLQEHMQRTAATAGTNSTAAAALAALDRFRRESVGLDRANSTGPLRAAKNRLQTAQHQLEQAGGTHAEYVRQLGEVEELERDVSRAEYALQIVEAAQARLLASQAQQGLERARQLASMYPESPRASEEGDSIAQAARLALDRWNNRPVPVDLTGPSAEELQNQLAEIEREPQKGESRKPSDIPLLLRPFVFLARLITTIIGSLFGRKRGSADSEARLRDALESAYESRKLQELHAADAERRRNEAGSSLREVAFGLEFQGANDEELAGQFQPWLEAYEGATADRRRAAEEWVVLENLLGGGSIQDLEQVGAQKNRTAEEFAQGLDVQDIAEVVLEDDIEAQLRRLRSHRSNYREALSDKLGRLDEFARAVPSIAEVEEEVARAEAELQRVTELGRVLARTHEYLTQAQDKIHRTLAPLLRDALNPWLQAVTGGRYSDVTVDVETLMVQVSGSEGNWRNAALLSHGTAEQIYLLLRVTMARLLTRPGELCPLLFDDVTVHCDAARQNEILNILHAVSREQQVILFSQEPETLEWAGEHLSDEMDRLVELDLQGIPA